MRATRSISEARQRPRWRAEGMMALIAVCLGAGLWVANPPRNGPAHTPAPPLASAGSTAAPAAPVPVAASPAVAPTDARQRLIGRWLRPDGGYLLTIREVDEAGVTTALYHNPRPVNVAKAQTTNEGGKVALYVELRDRGYPGSYYTLSYDPGSDQLTGVYHHLGLGQNFEVNFERLREEVGGRQ